MAVFAESEVYSEQQKQLHALFFFFKNRRMSVISDRKSTLNLNQTLNQQSPKLWFR